MPQLFLSQAGVDLKGFKGQPGFSKSHDATLELVQAGTYNAGVLNEQVWMSRLQEGKADPEKVTLVWRSPAYYDYHWLINPSVSDRFGKDFSKKVQTALLKLDPRVPEHKEILDLFGAESSSPPKTPTTSRLRKLVVKLGKLNEKSNFASSVQRKS
jgi:phosphonate transport system substrate-binding protein